MLTFTNARLFDGREMRPGRHSVTLDGNLIAAAGQGPAVAGETIDLDGMTLMPGLITSHLHADFYKYDLSSGAPPGIERPPGVMMAIGVRTCRVLLESGFTGYVGASCTNDVDAQLKIAIAEGIVPGPRIRACSRHIGTSADYNDPAKWWMSMNTPGTDIFGNGPDELRAMVREEIRKGAQTIKIFAGSGHGIDGKTMRNMDTDEIKAIVDAAHGRGAKVRAHVADKATILECIELGVDIIDHGDDTDDEVIAAMVENGTYWVPSLVYVECLLKLGYGSPLMQSQYEHVKRTLPRAQKAGVNILIGDDYSGILREAIEDDPLDHQVGRYGREVAYYSAIEGISVNDVLTWGTSIPGTLLADGAAKVGVVEPGAVADLIVIDGDPLTDPTLMARPDEALKAVIRDGAFHIDRLKH